MFLRSRSTAVGAFTPPALPGFLAIPAPIPKTSGPLSSSGLPCHDILGPLRSPDQEPSSLAWLIRWLNVLLDAVCDPGAEAGSCLWRACLCCLRPLARHLPTRLLISGLTTRFSVSRFTSQPFFVAADSRTLGVEFPSLTLSVVRRVPNYSLVLPSASTRYGMADQAFPGGIPALLSMDHLQVYAKFNRRYGGEEVAVFFGNLQ